MAFTSIAALAAGTAEVTAALVLSAVAEVGLAMTVVGAVTGEKSLMKIGGTLSLIGGVGGMVAGAMGSSAGAAAGGLSGSELVTQAAGDTAFGVAGDAAASAGAGALEAGLAPSIFEQAASSGMSDAAAGALAGPQTSAVTQSAIQGTALEPAVAMPGEQFASKVQPLATDVADVAAPAGAQAPAGAPDVGAKFGVTDPNVNPTDMRLGAGTQTTPGGLTAPEPAGSFFNRLSSFANKNKVLFSSGMQMLGGAMQGANQRDMWNQKIALEREALARKSHGNAAAKFQPRSIFQGAAA